jgi:hypothetical protein
VVRVQDEDAVHGARQDRVHLIVLRRHREAHAQEVLRIALVVARIHERLTDRIFERARRDRGHLGDHPVRGDFALHRVMDVGAVVVEGRQRAHRAHHDRHRVGVAAEAREELVELLVQHGVVGDVALELLVFGRRRQLAVQQQVADLEEARLLGQLADRVAAVQQRALVAVNVGDGAFAGGGGGEARVVGEGVRLRIELADVDHVGPTGALQDRQFHGLAVQLQGRRPAGLRLAVHQARSLQAPGAMLRRL